LKKQSETKTRSDKQANKKKNADWVDLPTIPAVFDANVAGLEKLAEELTETQKKIFNVIVSDFSDEPEAEAEMNIFKRLRAACRRAGMLEDGHKQVDFFRVLQDEKFQHIVKTVGAGMVGMYVVPLMAKQIELALGGSQTALDRLFEIMGLKQSKYDFYLQRVALNKTDINVGGDLNFEGKTDAELKKLVTSLRDDKRAEATIS